MQKAIRSVPKRFDDQLEALLGYIQQQGWTITGVDIDELVADLANQRSERVAKLEAERNAAAVGEAFLQAQAARYGRYMKALEVLRAAHRDDPQVQRALAQFKREAKRPSSATDTTVTE